MIPDPFPTFLTKLQLFNIDKAPIEIENMPPESPKLLL